MAGKSFGFVTQTGRQIDLDLVDTTLADEIAQMVTAWRACINCGSCVATCPAGVSFRELGSKIKLPTLRAMPAPKLKLPTIGISSPNLELATLRSCFLCGKCQLVCPRGIPTRYISLQIMQRTKSIENVAKGIPSV